MNCIVCVGIGNWHPLGVQRLAESLRGWDGVFYGWSEQYPPECPAHQEVPYGFKVRALQYGLSHNNFECENVLWLDSSFWAIGDVNRIFDIIDRDGYFLWHSGWNCSTWTNDKSLRYFNVTRDEAESIPMIAAGCLGLSRRSPVAMSFLDQWDQAMRSGTFQGAHKRSPEDKEDSRYRGHRHDQSSASILAYQHGMRIHEGDDLVSYWREDLKPTTVLTLRGL